MIDLGSIAGLHAHDHQLAAYCLASQLQRWLLGTHQGAVQPEHLDDYLDEFTFRFNRRSSRSRGLLFYRLMAQITASEPVSYRALTAPTRKSQPIVGGGAKWIAPSWQTHSQL
jgi:carotenoid cleavage dioxygenase-like enzyme